MDSDLITMSFSQMSTYRRCKKAWAFDKVDKHSGIPGLASIRGTRFHSAIESCVAEETESKNPYVQNALKLLKSFDEVKPEVYLEHIEDGVKVRGYADIIATDYIDVSGSEDSDTYAGPDREDVTVIDWKFPLKKPGSCKPDHKRQLNLYALLTDAETCQVVFPEYDKAYKFYADHEVGREVLQDCIDVGVEIRDTKANETSGFDTEGTYNYLCKAYCSHRAICPLGGE